MCLEGGSLGALCLEKLSSSPLLQFSCGCDDFAAKFSSSSRLLFGFVDWACLVWARAGFLGLGFVQSSGFVVFFFSLFVLTHLPSFVMILLFNESYVV